MTTQRYSRLPTSSLASHMFSARHVSSPTFVTRRLLPVLCSYVYGACPDNVYVRVGVPARHLHNYSSNFWYARWQ